MYYFRFSCFGVVQVGFAILSMQYNTVEYPLLERLAQPWSRCLRILRYLSADGLTQSRLLNCWDLDCFWHAKRRDYNEKFSVRTIKEMNRLCWCSGTPTWSRNFSATKMTVYKHRHQCLCPLRFIEVKPEMSAMTFLIMKLFNTYLIYLKCVI